MLCSWILTKSTLIRCVVISALMLAAVAVAPTAEAQGAYCQDFTDTLITHLNYADDLRCVSSPNRDRALNTETFSWNGGVYLLLSRGNELEIYDIGGTNATNPDKIDGSRFNFGTAGDSDYDVVSVDVCDNCRYGVMDHKVAGVVVFDFGTGSEPDFTEYSRNNRLTLSSKVFSHDNQVYLIAGGISESCSQHALFAVNGVNSLVELQCIEVGGSAVSVSGGASVEMGSTSYLYLGTGLFGDAAVFKTSGTGLGLRLEHTSSPSGMKGQNHNLAVNEAHDLVVSANRNVGEVRFWDLSNDPGNPQLKSSWSIPGNASMVALGSENGSSPLVLWTAATSFLNSSLTYLIDPEAGPQAFDNDFWGDLSEPHNEYQDCLLDMDGALAPDGSALYLSRYAMHQVFDLSACMGPTEAVADLTVTPASVFPGDAVTIRDHSSGSYDAWALWVERDSVFEAGETLPVPSNPSEMSFTVPKNVAIGEVFTANIEISNSGLDPAVPDASKPIGIDREPTAGFTVDPETAVVGESVTLSATAAANPSDTDTYVWTIDAPSSPPTTEYGAVIDVDLDISGDWEFTLTVNYDHGASGVSQDSDFPYDNRWGDLDGDTTYEYESSREYPVSSVAADFTISSDSQTGDLLNNSAITLDGGDSKGSIDLYEWTVYGPKNRTADCDNAPPGDNSACAMERDVCFDEERCVIPADALGWGAYDITLKVTGGGIRDQRVHRNRMFDSSTAKSGRPSISRAARWSGATNLIFAIDGVGVPIDKATWTMGGSGCDGESSTQVCTSRPVHDCDALAIQIFLEWRQDVGLEIEIGSTRYTDTRPDEERTITIASSGSCTTGGGGGGGGTTCTYTHSGDGGIAPGPAAAEFAFTVFTSYGCSWSATSTSSWINILNPVGTDSGTGTVRFAIQQNFGPARTGFVVAGGRSFRVDQGAPYVAANFTMSNPFPERGEVVTFTVDPILVVESWNFGEENCAGSSPQINCLFLPPGACNSIEWAFQTAGEKSVTMVLADDRTQTKHPVVQNKGECCFADGAPDASFVVSNDEIYTGELVSFTETSEKSSKNAKALGFSWTPPDPEIGETVTFRLEGLTGEVSGAYWNFGETGCNGAVQNPQCTPSLFNDCNAITFAFASGGAKNVSVNVDLSAGGSVSAGPTTVDVTNTGSCDTGGGGGGGTGCSWTISPTSVNFYPTGGVGSVNVTTTAECPWDATTTSSWINLTNASGTGSGVVTYNVVENTSENSRTGLVKIENKTHTVRQNGVEPVLDTAPTAWLWTVSLLLDEGGLDEVVATSPDQHFSYVFRDPGTYRVTLVASNCYGGANYSQTYEVLQAPVEDYVVGAAVSLAGDENTQWETDFRFFNPCDETLAVKVSYEPGGTNNTDVQLLSREFDLNANETRVFTDIVDVIPGLAGDELSGSARIESESASGCKVMTVSRTFNDTPDGSLGLNVPALPVKRSEFDLIGFAGLVKNEDYRTNFRLVNYGDEDAWVGLFMYDNHGNPVGAVESAPVPGHSTFQINDIAAWLKYDGDIDLFSVKADVRGRDLDAFATVIDNMTGDSVLHRSSFSEVDRVWLVGVANLAGAGDSEWHTDVWLYNPYEADSGQWLGGQGKFVVSGSSGDAYGFVWPLLAPGFSQGYVDVVGSVLGLQGQRGYMVLEGAPGLPVPQVAARTYNENQSGGTSGLGLFAFTEDDLLKPGETGFVAGISNNGDKNTGFRTNLGLVNTDESLWTTVKITLFGLGGFPAAEPWTLTIGPGVYDQWDIFKALGLEFTTIEGTIKVEVIEGGAVAIFGTEIDNRTQDSIYLPAQRRYIGLAP